MQTFLPFADFNKTAAVLDNARLGKQRVETLQILSVLAERTAAWRHHPAVLMWRGHAEWLMEYHFAIVAEWRHRGFNDTTASKAASVYADIRPNVRGNLHRPPFWMGFPLFHQCHRWNLAYKDSSLYPADFSNEMPSGEKPPYVWPKLGHMLRTSSEELSYAADLDAKQEPLLLSGRTRWNALLLDPTAMPAAFGVQLRGFGLLSHCLETRQKDGKAVIYLAERRF